MTWFPHHSCGTLHQPAPKAAGPDCITPRILKTCASQQSTGTSVQTEPQSGESRYAVSLHSCLVPGPKKSRSSDPADYRPVTLTSRDERPGELSLGSATAMGEEASGPLAVCLSAPFRSQWCCHLPVATRHMHLDGRNALFDFSSGFNTIQPLILDEKLLGMCVDNATISWIIHYLTGRLQFVRLGSVLSDVVVSNTGALQGTVLSPFLFTFYTIWLSHLCFNVSGYYFHASINIKT